MGMGGERSERRNLLLITSLLAAGRAPLRTRGPAPTEPPPTRDALSCSPAAPCLLWDDLRLRVRRGRAATSGAGAELCTCAHPVTFHSFHPEPVPFYLQSQRMLEDKRAFFFLTRSLFSFFFSYVKDVLYFWKGHVSF